jgi:osmoprotectant transport system ATP-binding protein
VAVFATGGRLAQYDVPARVLGRPADDFVSEFVGASRGLRRLSVTPIEEADLEPVTEVPPAETVPLAGTLEDALSTLLRHDAGSVGVTREGTTIGVLTPTSVHRALRRSLAGGQEDGRAER